MSLRFDLATARALKAHMATTFHVTVVDRNDAWARDVEQLATLALRKQGVPGEFALAAADVVSRTSVTIGPLVVLAPGVSSDDARLAEVITHECEHKVQEDDYGMLQDAQDMLLSAELRATREAHAYGAGLFVQHLVTGEPLEVNAAVERLRTGPYHLGPDELDLARNIVRSHVESVLDGVCPPLRSAKVALAWLQTHAQEMIVPAHFRTPTAPMGSP